jgi:hypothetical protein
MHLRAHTYIVYEHHLSTVHPSFRGGGGVKFYPHTHNRNYLSYPLAVDLYPAWEVGNEVDGIGLAKKVKSV